MITPRTNIGKIGENIACKYLISGGYKILERNYREKWDEIDIIAMARDGTLVFFEVKTFSSQMGDLSPEDNMTKSKLKKLKRACQMFAAKHPDLINNNLGWRIDFIAVTLGDTEADAKIKYYENI